MGGKFLRQSITTCEQTMFELYDFIANSGQTVLRIVENTGVKALYKQGTGYVSSWASSSDCPDGSYMVIEPVSANGGVRWQLRLKNDAADTTKAIFAPDGTWSNGGAGPGSFSGVQTAETTINDGAAPGASSFLYCGCNTVSYDAGTRTYTYFWFMINDSGAANQMCYAGGFTPFNPDDDTKPACFLARNPDLNSSSGNFGRTTADSNALSRCASEYAHSTTWNTSGYARVGFSDNATSAGATTTARNLGGEYIGLTLYLLSNSGGYWHGHFGDHMLAIDTGRTNYDTNVAATYIVLGDLFVYYDEAL
jgi:hypothetical protein